MVTEPIELRTPSEVYPGLWLAGSRWPYPALGLDLLVTLCRPHEIRHSPAARRSVTLAMRDASIDGATETEIHSLALEVAAAVRRGERVMVRCQWGVERSGMVAALAMRLLTGRSFAEVLASLRSRRSEHVLFDERSAACRVARGSLPAVD